MTWKDVYEKVVEGICKQDYRNFENIYEQDMPEFQDILVDATDSGENDLYSNRLDENVAKEKDYKAFVEYIFAYIGYNLSDFINESEIESEDNDMQEEKIRNLLKKYGAADSEIENFMNDLMEVKEDIDDFNYLDADTMGKLKSSDEGKRLIMNAPKMQKEELKKAVTELLNK